MKLENRPARDTEVKDGLDLAVGHARCPFCHEAVRPGDLPAKRSCDRCMAWHHLDCWHEHGRCASCDALGEATNGRGTSRRRQRLGPMALFALLLLAGVWVGLILGNSLLDDTLPAPRPEASGTE